MIKYFICCSVIRVERFRSEKFSAADEKFIFQILRFEKISKNREYK